MKKVIVIVAVIVVLGIAGAAFFLLTGGDNENRVEPVVRVPHEVGQFISNVYDSDRLMLRTSITLVSNTDEAFVMILLAEESARIRHIILMEELRTLTEADLRSRDGHDLLGRRILHEVNSALGIDNFVEVLFTEFVIA